MRAHTRARATVSGAVGEGARLPAGLEGPGGWSRGRAPPLLGLQGPRQRDAHGAADPLQQRRKQLGVEPEHRGPGRRRAHHLVQRARGLGTGAASGSVLPQGLAVKAGPCTPKPAQPAAHPGMRGELGPREGCSLAGPSGAGGRHEGSAATWGQAFRHLRSVPPQEEEGILTAALLLKTLPSGLTFFRRMKRTPCPWGPTPVGP